MWMIPLFYYNDKEISMANNLHKRIFQEDKFGRKYYCEGARLRQLRSDKKQSERMIRRVYKKELEERIAKLDS